MKMTSVSLGFGDSVIVRFGNAFADMKNSLQYRAHARRVANDMFALSVPGLEDLGFCRADESDIAAGRR